MKTGTKSPRIGMVGRGAFTLIELMVVIVIIAALVALSASAVIKYIEVQQNANTQSILDRTQSQLSRAWSKVKDEAFKETMSPVTVEAWIFNNLAGSDANAVGRARVIYVKLKLRQAFPMTFNEALNPFPFPPLQAYVTYLHSLNITGSSAATAPYESSACLLMALQRGVSGAGINPSDITRGGFTGSYTTPNGGSLPYLTDAWGRPIYFSRFPTGCPVLNPNGAQPGANDPGDPNGYLQTPNWGASSFGSTFETLTLQQLATGNTSYKLSPMVASGGPVNWTRQGQQLPFDPITFGPPSGGSLAQLLSSGAMFSNP